MNSELSATAMMYGRLFSPKIRSIASTSRCMVSVTVSSAPVMTPKVIKTPISPSTSANPLVTASGVPAKPTSVVTPRNRVPSSRAKTGGILAQVISRTMPTIATAVVISSRNSWDNAVSVSTVKGPPGSAQCTHTAPLASKTGFLTC